MPERILTKDEVEALFLKEKAAEDIQKKIDKDEDIDAELKRIVENIQKLGSEKKTSAFQQKKLELQQQKLDETKKLQENLREIKTSDFIRFTLDKIDDYIVKQLKLDDAQVKDLRLAFRKTLVRSYLEDQVYDFESYVANNISDLLEIALLKAKVPPQHRKTKPTLASPIEALKKTLKNELLSLQTRDLDHFEIANYQNPFKTIKEKENNYVEIDETPEKIKQLSPQAAKALYEGTVRDDTQKPKPPIKRRELLEHLKKVLSNDSFPFDPEKNRSIKKGGSISLVDLLGKEGVKLYIEALIEETSDPRFRQALLRAAAKVYKGKELDDRIVARIIGPAAIGKTSGQDQAIAQLLTDPNFANGVDNFENLFLSVDGALDREQSQMWGLMKQVAMKKGFSEINDLYKISKPYLSNKKIIDEVAESEGFHKVVPDTCTSTAGELTLQNPFMKVFEEDSARAKLVLVHITPTQNGKEKVTVLRNGKEEQITSEQRTERVTHKNGKSRSKASVEELKKAGLQKIDPARVVKAEFKAYEGDKPLDSTKPKLFHTKFGKYEEEDVEQIKTTYEAGREASNVAAEVLLNEFARTHPVRSCTYFVAETDLSALKIVGEKLVECDPNETGAVIACARDIEVWNKEWKAYVESGKTPYVTDNDIIIGAIEPLSLKAWLAIHIDRKNKLTSNMEVRPVTPVTPVVPVTRKLSIKERLRRNSGPRDPRESVSRARSRSASSRTLPRQPSMSIIRPPSEESDSLRSSSEGSASPPSSIGLGSLSQSSGDSLSAKLPSESGSESRAESPPGSASESESPSGSPPRQPPPLIMQEPGESVAEPTRDRGESLAEPTRERGESVADPTRSRPRAPTRAAPPKPHRPQAPSKAPPLNPLKKTAAPASVDLSTTKQEEEQKPKSPTTPKHRS